MVRRRSSLIRGWEHADPDVNPEHIAVVSGVRASFVAPRDRNDAMMRLYEKEECEERHRLSSAAHPPQVGRRRSSTTLGVLYQKNPKRYSWAKAPSLRLQVSDEASDLDLLADLYPEMNYGSVRQPSKIDEEGGSNEECQSEKASIREMWTARAMLLVSTILYGSSFPFIKILDESMPVGISLTLRFLMAALVTFPWLFETPAIDWDTSLRATLQGCEVGMWDAVGFLTQAASMVTEKATKVCKIFGHERCCYIPNSHYCSSRRFTVHWM